MTKFDSFNELAENWDQIYPRDLNKIRTMLDLLYIKNGDNVLDAGCGTGILIPFLLEKTDGEKITAVDGAEKMIQKAKQKFPDKGIRFIASDVTEYNFAPASFNHIICYSVFPHIEDKKSAAKHFSRLLAEGGLLSILHSDSKEKINHIHSESDEVNSENLKSPAGYIPLFNMEGLHEEIVIDNSEMYMLCVRKQ